MKIDMPKNVRILVNTFTRKSGSISRSLRKAILHTSFSPFARKIIENEEEKIPEAIIGYLEKVSRYAYKITKEDIHTLKQLGYTEDQIFEITLAASLGAGLTRMEAGFRALQEGK